MKAILLGILLWAGMLWHSALSLIPTPPASPAQTQETETSSPEPSVLPTAENASPSSPPPAHTSVSFVPAVAQVPAPEPVPEPQPQTEGEYTAEFTVALEAAIHEGINKERVNNGLKPLKYDTKLADIARGHSFDMAKENYFAHEDSKGCASDCRLDRAGYKWLWVGENIFLMKSNFRYSVADAAAVIVQGWMGSEGHRKNILQTHFTNEGLGVVTLGDAIYSTEDFSRPK